MPILPVRLPRARQPMTDPSSHHQFNPYASPETGGPEQAGVDARVPFGSPVRIGGALTRKELYHAMKVGRGSSPGGTAVGCAVMALLWILPWGILALVSKLAHSGVVLLTMLIGGLIIGITFDWIKQLRRLERHCRLRAGVFEAQNVVISDSQIEFTSQTSRAVHQWGAFSCYSRSDRVLLLHFDPPASTFYDPPAAFVIVPRSFFRDAGQWERFVEFIAARLPKKS
jgi:hypothetical protein